MAPALRRTIASLAATAAALPAVTVGVTNAPLSSTAPIYAVAHADPAPRTTAPDTSQCPQATYPPEAETTSEALTPGQVAPTPPPTVVNEYGSCDITAPADYVVPANTAAAWMVFDIDTGDVISTKDPHGRYRPASVIKVLLAMVALNELTLSDTYVATAEDQNQEGSAVGIREGLTYTNEQLLYGLLLNSGNDAAHALATELGGDEVALEKVRALAHSLGAVDTFVASYSGLDAPGMMTSARDLAVFYSAAWQNETFARMLATEKVTFPGPSQEETYEVWNDNGLFMNDPDGIGGKTGYTDDAHHTFVGAKDIGGRRLAAVILDTTIDDGRAWKQAQALIEAAYASQGAIGNLRGRDVSAHPGEATSGNDATELPTAMNVADERAEDGGGKNLSAGVFLLAAIVGIVGVVLLAGGARQSRKHHGKHQKS